jgi:hypothetical protein
MQKIGFRILPKSPPESEANGKGEMSRREAAQGDRGGGNKASVARQRDQMQAQGDRGGEKGEIEKSKCFAAKLLTFCVDKRGASMYNTRRRLK